MTANPLSYESLKTVIQYLEANRRFQISNCIPSIRIVEKQIPLRLNSLVFETVNTIVNSTSYRVAVYREYQEGYDVPKHHKSLNERGGDRIDQTEHGFQIDYVHQAITPGDVNISFPLRPNFRLREEEVQDNKQLLYERHVELYGRALAIRKNSPFDGFEDNDFNVPIEIDLRQAQLAPRFQARLEEQLFNRIGTFSAKRLEECIEYLQSRLVPYYCRRDNTPLPYTHWLQLSIRSARGEQREYRHPYNMRIQDGMKQVNTVLFGGRKCIHKLHGLSVIQKRMVIKLPEHFRMRIRSLSVVGDVMLNYTALRAIVEDSSYPLDLYKMREDVLNAAQYNNPVVQEAKRLEIISTENLQESCLALLLSLNKRSIKFQGVSTSFTLEEQCLLIKHWIENDKDLGTNLSYEILGDEAYSVCFLEHIARQFLGRFLYFEVIVQMNNGNNLEIALQRTRSLRRIPELRWRVQMTVVAANGVAGN